MDDWIVFIIVGLALAFIGRRLYHKFKAAGTGADVCGGMFVLYKRGHVMPGTSDRTEGIAEHLHTGQ